MAKTFFTYLYCVFCALFMLGGTDILSDEYIRKSVELIATGEEVSIGNEKLRCQNLLPVFYERRLFQA